MHGRTEIENAITEALAQVVTERGESLCRPAGAETRLIGQGTPIDSLGLVNLLLDVEIAVADMTGVPIELMSERAMSQSRSPFRTIGALTDYVLLLLEEARPIGAAATAA